MRRLLITGTNSGCGKTTVTCAVLAALNIRGIRASAFKCGSDYIDPMFHRAVSGTKSYNLDPFLLDGNGLRLHLYNHGEKFSLIEGAMGYYDGIATTDEASTYTVARETDTPVVIVVNAKGMGHSIAAIIEGYVRYRSDSQIKGVIFNEVNENRYWDLQEIAKISGVRAYGFLPRNEEWAIPNRYLGLHRAEEITDLQDKISLLEKKATETLDIDGLIELAETAPDFEVFTAKDCIKQQKALKTRLAVAKDEAFCFIYEENIDLLKEMGCEPVFFSPLRNETLPANVNGLYLCGGYPELYTKTLSENKTMLECIQKAIRQGLPTIAEGGGFLYLHKAVDDFPMCGVIHGNAFKTGQLKRFGYITLSANHDNLLCKAGETIRSREFHYWDSDCSGSSFTAHKTGRDVSYSCIFATDTLYAGFPHLYFPANLKIAGNFVERMKQYEFS